MEVRRKILRRKSEGAAIYRPGNEEGETIAV
jgi:hypothetical protein